MKTTTITDALKALGIRYTVLTVCGTDYLVTQDTGEGVFAYDADGETDGRVANYDDFCDAFDSVGEDDVNFIEIAVACAVEGMRLTIAGACTPALTDREWRIARLAAGRD